MKSGGVPRLRDGNVANRANSLLILAEGFPPSRILRGDLE
jgi:hypothetical protein